MLGRTGQGLTSPRTAEAWLAKLQGDCVDADDLLAFRQWLEEDPQNRTESERLFDAWEEAGMLSREPAVEAFQADATLQQTRVGIRSSWAVAAAVVCVLLGSVALWQRRDADPPSRATHLEASIGSQNSVQLGDGSTLLLNSGAAVNVDAGAASARRVQLERGEVLFEVARDASRPFIVDAGLTQVRVLGTVFAVERRDDCVSVGVLEGRVEVRLGNGSLRLLEASEAEICEASSSSSFLGRVEAWREGRLEFVDTPLSQVVKELNRYSESQWRLEDPSLESLRVSGSYFIESIADVDSLAFALRATLGLEAVKEGSGIVLRSP